MGQSVEVRSTSEESAGTKGSGNIVMTGTGNPGRFDVIVIGGSYSGLAAALALGRALRTVLIIDSGRPCNARTPHSHNFITQDGKAPGEIAALARQQVQEYGTVEFVDGIVTAGLPMDAGFLLQTESGTTFSARKLIFATGIEDQLPSIAGLAECWGISGLHCPYCHGYEVRHRPTGILGNGESGFDLAGLVANWTKDLTLLTNGSSGLTLEQSTRLNGRGIEVVSQGIASLEQEGGHLQQVILQDGTRLPLEVLYLRPKFEQHSRTPEALGCELTQEGYIRVEPSQRTSVPGIYACGDNSSIMRTVANAVATGTTAGMMANRELVFEDF
jgi:thioredoxin reductase